jgi:hypothetical protein
MRLTPALKCASTSAALAAADESEPAAQPASAPGGARKLSGIEADEWDEDAALAQPQAGFETPSEPGTPGHSPRGGQCASGAYYQPTTVASTGGDWGQGLTCVDQWDWKTDAPEFVPSFAANNMGALAELSITSYTADSAVKDNGGSGGCGNSSMVVNLRTQYEMQLQRKYDEVQRMKDRIRQLENETTQAQASNDAERRRLMANVKRHRDVLELYCIPLEEAAASNFNMAIQDESTWQYGAEWAPAAVDRRGRSMGQLDNRAWVGGYGDGGNTAANSKYGSSYGSGACAGDALADSSGNAMEDLDSKMRQLGGLISAGRARGGGRFR